jgi:hypothetical protein
MDDEGDVAWTGRSWDAPRAPDRASMRMVVAVVEHSDDPGAILAVPTPTPIWEIPESVWQTLMREYVLPMPALLGMRVPDPAPPSSPFLCPWATWRMTWSGWSGTCCWTICASTRKMAESNTDHALTVISRAGTDRGGGQARPVAQDGA